MYTTLNAYTPHLSINMVVIKINTQSNITREKTNINKRPVFNLYRFKI